jgi:hypothetical protein
VGWHCPARRWGLAASAPHVDCLIFQPRWQQPEPVPGGLRAALGRRIHFFLSLSFNLLAWSASQPAPDPAGVRHRRRRLLGRVRRQPAENLLQRRPAHLRRIGEQLPQLVDLLLGGRVLSGSGRRRCFCRHVCHSFRFFTVQAMRVQATRSASLFACQVRLSTSSIAWTKSSGASCGRLWPMPPVSVRCAYLPVNRAA